MGCGASAGRASASVGEANEEAALVTDNGLDDHPANTHTDKTKASTKSPRMNTDKGGVNGRGKGPATGKVGEAGLAKHLTPNGQLPSAASSTHLIPDSKRPHANHTNHLAGIHSHSSKRNDSLSDDSTDDVLSKLLTCRNCEEAATPISVWCSVCYVAGDDGPPVYCNTCNQDLHQFAKTRSHVREPVRSLFHSSRVKDDLQPRGGLPKVECLACSNCDTSEVSVFCVTCRSILCTECARDIHSAKQMQHHVRPPLFHRYILSGIGKRTDLNGAGVDPDTTSATNSLKNAFKMALVNSPAKQPGGSISATSSPAKAGGGLGRGGIAALTRIKPSSTDTNATGSTAPLSASASTSSSTPVKPALTLSIRPPTNAPAVDTFMPKDSPRPRGSRMLKKAQRISNATEDGAAIAVAASGQSDIMPVENPGVNGDVFICADPSLTESLNEIQLEFRNVINPYDMIGSVQVVNISCGMDHMGAVTAMGTLFMLGSNVEGQLGCGSALGTSRFSREPILIEFPRHRPVKQVACGSVHTLALCQDSTVWSWGEGKMGKLGLVSDEDRDVPTQVQLRHWGPLGEQETADMSGEEEVTFVACGQNNSGCVVRRRKDKHQLYIWGEGASGQIPPPTQLLHRPGSKPTDFLAPKLAPQLVQVHLPESRTEDPYPEIALLAFGTKHVAMVTAAGSVLTHGDNSFGQCGYVLSNNDEDGASLGLQLTPRIVPKLFLEGVAAKSIACGERHTTVLSRTGDVWSWGSGESHQIGILDNIDQFEPMKAVGLGLDVGQVVTHISVGAAISTAVTEKGETWMWGYGVESPTPQLVQGLRGKFIQQACVGSNSNVAFLTGSSSELYEWQFDGLPLDAEETHGVAAGEAVTAACISAAAAAATGGEQEDQPGGKGTPAVNTSLRGKKIISMSSGKNHYIAVTADGKMFAWGSNQLYECGVRLPGDITYIPHPLQIKCSHSIVSVMCGVEHSIALTSEGHVLTWGTNGFDGRLGHGSNADQSEPKIVQSLVDAHVTVTSMAIGPANCAVVGKDGSLWIWGAGNRGQIGNDELLPQFKPIRVKHLEQEHVTSVSIGNSHVMVLTAKKQVYTFGDNKFGQLGLYPSFQEDHAAYPQSVDSLNMLALSPEAIECGDNVCIVLTAGGELYGWGSGETNQLCLKGDSSDEGGDGGDCEDQMDAFAGQEDCPAPMRLVMPFQKPPNMLKVLSVSVRDINCCCLTEDGRVWSWGWDLGEYPTPLILSKATSNKPAQRTIKTSAAAAAAAATSSSDPSTQGQEIKWGKVALGHTRMLLMTA